MNALVRQFALTHRTTPRHMQHASEHLHMPPPSRTNLLWRGTQRPPKSSCPRRSSVWACGSDWEWLSFQRIYPVDTSHRRAPAVHTC
eukprot:1552059-Amphidinium_carterae.1